MSVNKLEEAIHQQIGSTQKITSIFGDIMDEYFDQIEKTETVIITKSMEENIHKISHIAKECEVYKNNHDRGEWYRDRAKNEPPENILNDCVRKVAISPTYIHTVVTIILLMPIISEKLKQERGNE